jgi:ATP-dependent Clp endopeptidase proteolytic subunit ClpP
MAKLRIYNDIDSQDNKFWYQWFGGDCVCFQDIDAFAASIPKDDDTIDMRIFCNGGSVVEGWAIYDRLRQSGKKITCTIEGKAASMATIIMLAAPKESRKAYENAAFLLHNPWIPGWCMGDQLNAKDLKNQGEEMQMWQDKMVDAYVERCGCDREEIQALMDKDIFISTSEALRLGLISSTVAPISASASKRNIEQFINSKQQNPKAMEKKTEVKASLLACFFGLIEVFLLVAACWLLFVLDEFLAGYLLEVFLHLWVLRQIFVRYLVGQVLISENLTIVEIRAGNDEACLHYVITLLWHSLFFFEF